MQVRKCVPIKIIISQPSDSVPSLGHQRTRRCCLSYCRVRLKVKTRLMCVTCVMCANTIRVRGDYKKIRVKLTFGYDAVASAEWTLRKGSSRQRRGTRSSRNEEHREMLQVDGPKVQR